MTLFAFSFIAVQTVTQILQLLFPLDPAAVPVFKRKSREPPFSKFSQIYIISKFLAHDNDFPAF